MVVFRNCLCFLAMVPFIVCIYNNSSSDEKRIVPIPEIIVLLGVNEQTEEEVRMEQFVNAMMKWLLRFVESKTKFKIIRCASINGRISINASRTPKEECFNQSLLNLFRKPISSRKEGQNLLIFASDCASDAAKKMVEVIEEVQNTSALLFIICLLAKENETNSYRLLDSDQYLEIEAWKFADNETETKLFNYTDDTNLQMNLNESLSLMEAEFFPCVYENGSVGCATRTKNTTESQKNQTEFSRKVTTKIYEPSKEIKKVKKAETKFYVTLAVGVAGSIFAIGLTLIFLLFILRRSPKQKGATINRENESNSKVAVPKAEILEHDNAEEKSKKSFSSSFSVHSIPSITGRGSDKSEEDDVNFTKKPKKSVNDSE